MHEEGSKGKWVIPGGKLDSTDPNLEVGVARESLEEVGVEIGEIELFRNYVVQGRDRNTIYMIFTATYLSGIAEALEDTDQVGWFNKDTMPAAEMCAKNVHRNVIDAMSW